MLSKVRELAESAKALELTEQDWAPQEATTLILKQEMEWLTSFRAPGGDGLTALERVFKLYPDENQRNALIDDAIEERLHVAHPKLHAFFLSDCPDYGACRFHLWLGLTEKQTRNSNPAHFSYNINLLKPHHEWVYPPMGLK